MPDQFKVDFHVLIPRIMNAVSMGEKRNAYEFLIGKPEGKGHLEPRRRWENNNDTIKFKAIGWEVVDWVYLAQNKDQWLAVVK
jgi:hypothetical protein